MQSATWLLCDINALKFEKKACFSVSAALFMHMLEKNQLCCGRFSGIIYFVLNIFYLKTELGNFNL